MNGYRYYSDEQLHQVLGIRQVPLEIISDIRSDIITQRRGYKTSEEQELVEDLIQIATVFSYRLQGKRANKARKMIKELASDDENLQSRTRTE